MELNWQEQGWMLAAAIGVLGLLLGLLIGWLGRGRGTVKDVETLKKEHHAYKEDVSLHFEQTGQLVQQMTEQYKALYDHLAKGAVSLAEGENSRFPLLADASGERAIESEAVTAEDAEQKSDTDTAAEDAVPETEASSEETAEPQLPPDVPAPEAQTEAKDDIDTAIDAAEKAKSAHLESQAGAEEVASDDQSTETDKAAKAA